MNKKKKKKSAASINLNQQRLLRSRHVKGENESDSDTEEGEDGDENESDLEVEKSRAVSPKVRKEIKWNKEGKNKLRRVYGIWSRATSKRQRKSARELDEQAKQTYDIRALWKQNLDLGMISPANSQVRLGQPLESQSIDDVSSSSSLSKVDKVVYLIHPTKRPLKVNELKP